MGDTRVEVVRGCNFRMAWQSLHEKMHLRESRAKGGEGEACGYLGKVFRAERTEVQRPWGRIMPGVFGQHGGGPRSWSRVSKRVMARVSRREMRAGRGQCSVFRACKWWGGFGVGSKRVGTRRVLNRGWAWPDSSVHRRPLAAAGGRDCGRQGRRPGKRWLPMYPGK